MDQISFLPIIEGQKIEHTQATYYTSDLYKKPLTPDHVLGATNFWDVERGQIPYPMNRWTCFDAWYIQYKHLYIHHLKTIYKIPYFT